MFVLIIYVKTQELLQKCPLFVWYYMFILFVFNKKKTVDLFSSWELLIQSEV